MSCRIISLSLISLMTVTGCAQDSDPASPMMGGTSTGVGSTGASSTGAGSSTGAESSDGGGFGDEFGSCFPTECSEPAVYCWTPTQDGDTDGGDTGTGSGTSGSEQCPACEDFADCIDPLTDLASCEDPRPDAILGPDVSTTEVSRGEDGECCYTYTVSVTVCV